MKSTAFPSSRVLDLKTLVWRAAEMWSDRIAVRFDPSGINHTFSEVEEISNQVSHYLDNLNIGVGDRVAIMLRNGPMWPLLWLGIVKSGAVMVPVNVYYRNMDTRFILNHSGSSVVFCESDLAEMISQLKDEAALPALSEIISVDNTLSDILGAQPSVRTREEVQPNSLANIQYTSGTTGQPKGCMLPHEWFLRFAQRMETTHYGLSETDVFFTSQPFYYVDPQWNLALSLLTGAELVVGDRFHPSRFWELVQHYRVTWFYCLGVMPNLLMKTESTAADHEHRVRFVTCSAIPRGIHNAIEKRWGVPWFESFGMTESGLDIAVEIADHDALVGSGCIGRPMKTRVARIVNEDGDDVPTGDSGELALSGPGLMQGYYKDPEATRAALRNGWLFTGDLAKMDESGLIYYVGRTKDMIRRAGENISATEVEDVIMQHQSVKMAACVAIPDDVRGEEIKCYIVLQSGVSCDELTPSSLINYLKDRLAYFKIPRYWCYRDDLPRTPSEKIIKSRILQEDVNPLVGVFDSKHGKWL